MANITDFHLWAIWPPPRLFKDSETPAWLGLKQVRISPAIDWYHYQSANSAPMAIVGHRKKTGQF